MIMQSVALLAPVPEEHLISGLVTQEKTGKVAFGSRAFQVFRDLDDLRDNQPVDVYIYASASAKFGLPKVRWIAQYNVHVEAQGGGHPDGRRFRPESTFKYGTDNQGFWAVFWEVSELRELSKQEAIAIDKFRGFRSRKSFVSGFIPEGPLLIERI
ncbi:hypothetical protein [Neorhizobium sp. AL 9.2.2]|uniref:hypothetical protein n=1 Tax=Neorhizobium sp. AL 9.2.2 TaxID=2712894 RepID=UPI001574C73F|nr:hypothetical protein [Neorhizobium sp. AL 9.2.2]NSY16305.1 hypothetical protein [Neorhizobium sp. AL 9.2.2]